MAELAERVIGDRRRAVRLPRQAGAQAESGGRLPGRQPQPPLPEHRQGARAAGLRAADRDRRRPAPLADLVPPQSRSGGGLMRISVIGTGYVGLVSGACFAEIGHDCICVDVDAAKVERINRGEPPIHENGLDDMLQRHVGDAPARHDRPARPPCSTPSITFIAVGTPFDGTAHRSHATSARPHARSAQRCADKPAYHVVVVKSTVVPGTTDDVVRRRARAGLGQARRRRFRRRHEPGVPHRRRRGRRLHAARSHRDRRQRRARDRRAARGVRAVRRARRRWRPTTRPPR